MTSLNKYTNNVILILTNDISLTKFKYVYRVNV